MLVKRDKKIEKIDGGVRITVTEINEFKGDELRKFIGDVKQRIEVLSSQLENFKRAIPEGEKQVSELKEDLKKLEEIEK